MIRDLQQSIERKKDEELTNSSEFIKERLNLEWAAQTGSKELRAQNRLRSDRAVQQAIQLIENPDRYHSILNP